MNLIDSIQTLQQLRVNNANEMYIKHGKIQGLIDAANAFLDDLQDKDSEATELQEICLNVGKVISGLEKHTKSDKDIINALDVALEELRMRNTVCEKCKGDGKVLRSRMCAEDDSPDPNDPNDWITCPECRGTGEARK